MDSKNETNLDSLQIGENLFPPEKWTNSLAYSVKDSLYAESDYWFAQPKWWEIEFEQNSAKANSVLWEDNGSPWFNAEYRYYNESTNTVYIWKWRRQWYNLNN